MAKSLRNNRNIRLRSRKNLRSKSRRHNTQRGGSTDTTILHGRYTPQLAQRRIRQLCREVICNDISYCDIYGNKTYDALVKEDKDIYDMNLRGELRRYIEEDKNKVVGCPSNTVYNDDDDDDDDGPIALPKKMK